MLSFEPNIIVIDDKQEEIQGILDLYNKQGVGCKFFNADYTDGDEMPDSEFSDVSLIFLDLFFSDEKFDAEQCAGWVRSIVSEKSFYTLIIWSKDPAKAQEVNDELKKHNRTPFLCLVKNKSDYIIKGTHKYNFKKLLLDIESSIEKTPSISEIGIWKKSIKRASNVVVGNLSKDGTPELFNSKLQKIIIGHGGRSIIASNNSNHKRTILFDALDQVLASNSNNSIHDELIDNINDKELYSLNAEVASDIDKELNSWFHFKLEKNLSKELISPGLLCEFNEDHWKKLYSIEDDFIIQNLLGRQKGEQTKISSIAMLLSRPCDIAQGKYGKNLKLISGVKVINPVRKNNARQEFQFNSSRPDSMKLYDHLYISEEESDIALLFDFRYVFSVPEKIFIEDFKNIAVFNKEVLSEMQVEYSSYSSRLGITQII